MPSPTDNVIPSSEPEVSAQPPVPEIPEPPESPDSPPTGPQAGVGSESPNILPNTEDIEEKLPENKPVAPPTPSVSVAAPSFIGSLLLKARNIIQIRKRKKLEKIMDRLTEVGKISNDEVEKLLHVSDATATRYLDILEREGRIKQAGRTGRAVFYVKA